jgi:phosphate starvation-inducible PhoH-like protein|tara:strand:- start:16 stop:711 length:696 start_codon:yes stop_codon:yes gene_type:complete
MAKASKRVGKNRPFKFSIAPITPATDNQRIAMGLMEDHQVVIMEGLAGTGKTFLAVHHALTQILKGQKEKLIFTRPLTTVGGEKMGFLPGDVNAKTRPYAEQFIEYLSEFSPMITMKDIEDIEEKIEFIPVGFLRGRNFRNSVIIADEFQNSTQLQMKTLLTRIEETSQLLILGDMKQEDVVKRESNGLSDLIYKLSTSPDQEFVGHVRFGLEDIQRGPFVKFVMKLYGEI